MQQEDIQPIVNEIINIEAHVISTVTDDNDRKILEKIVDNMSYLNSCANVTRLQRRYCEEAVCNTLLILSAGSESPTLMLDENLANVQITPSRFAALTKAVLAVAIRSAAAGEEQDTARDFIKFVAEQKRKKM